MFNESLVLDRFLSYCEQHNLSDEKLEASIRLYKIIEDEFLGDYERKAVRFYSKKAQGLEELIEKLVGSLRRFNRLTSHIEVFASIPRKAGELKTQYENRSYILGFEKKDDRWVEL